MENFARHHYENNVDQLVREELKQAGIPILELPCYMDTEVKTRYVGVLYGFFFYRAWCIQTDFFLHDSAGCDH